jgi:hypothetical protein
MRDIRFSTFFAPDIQRQICIRHHVTKSNSLFVNTLGGLARKRLITLKRTHMRGWKATAFICVENVLFLFFYSRAHVASQSCMHLMGFAAYRSLLQLVYKCKPRRCTAGVCLIDCVSRCLNKYLIHMCTYEIKNRCTLTHFETALAENSIRQNELHIS